MDDISLGAISLHVWLNFMHNFTQVYLNLQVFTMLCQILQTEDVNAVQAWLCSAGDRGR